MAKLRMQGDRITVERVIPAPPEAIFALLSDPARHHEFDGSGSVRATTYKGAPLELGSVFAMGMRMGVPYRMSNEVVELEPDRVIAWQTSLGGKYGKYIGGRIWRYELVPVAGGTLVKETWDLFQEHQAALLKRTPFVPKARRDMEKTLERLEQLFTQAPAA